MPTVQPRYSREEFARRGEEIYERVVKPVLQPSDIGKSVCIDIESGEFELDADEVAAFDRLLAKNSNAQIWVTQAGSRFARRFGPSRRVKSK